MQYSSLLASAGRFFTLCSRWALPSRVEPPLRSQPLYLRGSILYGTIESNSNNYYDRGVSICIASLLRLCSSITSSIRRCSSTTRFVCLCRFAEITFYRERAVAKGLINRRARFQRTDNAAAAAFPAGASFVNFTSAISKPVERVSYF